MNECVMVTNLFPCFCCNFTTRHEGAVASYTLRFKRVAGVEEVSVVMVKVSMADGSKQTFVLIGKL